MGRYIAKRLAQGLLVIAGVTVFVFVVTRMVGDPVKFMLPLSATELHTSLQSGLMNAFGAPPLAALSFQWFALAPHMTRLNWSPLLGVTLIKLEVWNRLPEQLRPQLLKAAEEAGLRQKSATRALSDQAVAVMQRHGLVVHEVPADAMRAWEESARAAYPTLIGAAVPPAAAAEVMRLRDEYRKQVGQ